MSEATTAVAWTSDNQCIYITLPGEDIHTYLRPEISIQADIFPLYAYIKDKSGNSENKVKSVVSSDSYFSIDITKATVA